MASTRLLRSTATGMVVMGALGPWPGSIPRSSLAPWSLDWNRARLGDVPMVMYAVMVMALSLADEPLALVAVGLLSCSAVGAVVLISDLLSSTHRDRLSIVAFQMLAWIVAALAATSLLLLTLSL